MSKTDYLFLFLDKSKDFLKKHDTSHKSDNEFSCSSKISEQGHQQVSFTDLFIMQYKHFYD